MFSVRYGLHVLWRHVQLQGSSRRWWDADGWWGEGGEACEDAAEYGCGCDHACVGGLLDVLEGGSAVPEGVDHLVVQGVDFVAGVKVCGPLPHPVVFVVGEVVVEVEDGVVVAVL